jgi:ATP-dependent RNA helicase DDX19/DBP5
MEPAKEEKKPESKLWSKIMEEEDEKKVQEGMEKLKATSTQESKDEDAPLATLEKKLQRVDTKGMNRGKIIVEQDDPKSPIHSTKSFEELNLKPELLQGIFALGFNKPSKIQECALPILLAQTNPYFSILWSLFHRQAPRT